MNWLLIVVLAIIALCMFEGYHKGFLRMIFSMVIMVIVLVASSFVTPYMKIFLTQYTGINEYIQQGCEDYIRQKAQEQLAESTGLITDQAVESGLYLPEALLDKLAGYGEGAVNDLVDGSGLYHELAESITEFVVGGIAYFLSVLLVFLISYVLMRILNLLAMLPGIKGVNKTAGLALGLVRGLLVIWLLFYLISMFCASSIGSQLLCYIDENEFLRWLYQHNLIMELIYKILLG
ncbi:MAG: CvpA family protein [Roseburia sp.]